MEYNNAYIDDGEIPQLEEDQSTSSGVSSHYMQHENGATDLGASSGPQHHPVVDEEELLAAQEAADAAVAQQQQHGTPGGVFSNVGQGLVGKNRDVMMQYWQETINSIEHDEHDFKNHQLPLARIKKVMKTDEDVRMISAEAPILFAKGCDVFITELTMRAWIHAEENKRRTLQKSDIAAALTKSDMFDFLIDVVPREEEKPKKQYPPRDAFGAHPSQLHMLHGSQIPQMRGPMPQIPQPPSMGNLQNSLQRPAGTPVHTQDLTSAPPTHTSNVSQGQSIMNQSQHGLPPSAPSTNPEGTGRRSPNENQGYNGHQLDQTTALQNGEPRPEHNVSAGALPADGHPKPNGPYYGNYTSYENNF
ncbi:hypothetical protein OXX69_005168 [Metschnikowia pulcherrima]